MRVELYGCASEAPGTVPESPYSNMPFRTQTFFTYRFALVIQSPTVDYILELSHNDKQYRSARVKFFLACLGHPHKMFRFPSPDRPIFFGKVKKIKNKKI